MPADIDTMAYSGALPWHGLGTYIGDQPVTNGQEMCEAAGLDWEIDLRPVFTCTASKSDGGQLVALSDDYRAVMRMDSKAVLGLVGGRYTPIQNADLFATLDSLTATGEMKYHTAGSLAGSKRVWALGKIGEHETVPGDRSDHYILAHSTHDGSGAFELIWTTVRVVCANTAAIALRQGRQSNRKLKVRHTRNASEAMKTARKALGLATVQINAHAEFERMLTQASMNHQLWEQFSTALIPDPQPKDAASLMDEVKVSNGRARAKRELLEELFLNGRGQDIPGIAGTMYAARNAVTEYVNYERQTRGENDDVRQANRFESAMFGSGAAMVDQADELLYEMLDAA